MNWHLATLAQLYTIVSDKDEPTPALYRQEASDEILRRMGRKPYRRVNQKIRAVIK